MLKQKILHNGRIYILTKLDNDTHSFTGRLVTKGGNSVQLLITYQFSDIFHQTSLVYVVWKFRNDNTVLSVLHRLNFGYGTNTDFASTGTICFFDTCMSQNGSSGREVRSFDNLHDFINIRLSVFLDLVINDFINGTNHFAKVVWRNVGCHTYCNTGGSVNQKVGVTSRKYGGFLFGFIKVRYKVYGIFIDIRKHCHGNLGKSCFGVTHSSGAVAIHRTEVTVSVYKWITCRPFLCHVNKCSVNRGITVWVIFTHGITDDTGTFTMWLVRTIVQLDHGIENSSLYRLQSVSNVRKCTGSDNAHGIIDIRRFHCFFQVNVLNVIKNLVVHFVSLDI